MATEQPTIEELTAQIAQMQERLDEQYRINVRNIGERDRILKAALAGRTMPYEMLVLEFSKYSAVDTDLIEREFDKIINKHSP